VVYRRINTTYLVKIIRKDEVSMDRHLDDSTIYISIVNPTRCTISQIYFIFGTKLYMFRTVFPSIVRSLRLYIQYQVYVVQVLWLLASSHRTCMV